MFRTTILPIFRSIGLYNTAYGMPVSDLVTEFLRHQITDGQRIGYTIPQTLLHSLMLLKMDKIVVRNMSS